VDLENVQSGILVRRRELDLAIDATRAEKGGVEDVDAVSGHDHLDVLRRLETVELENGDNI
jgi:hypothetical protein